MQTPQTSQAQQPQDAFEHLKCPLCYDYVTNNVICPHCEQCFCAPHLKTWLDEKSTTYPSCPMCRKFIGTLADCKHSQIVERVAMDIELLCTYKCGNMVKRGQFRDHIEQACSKYKIHCANDGCDFFDERHVVQSKHAEECMYKVVTCDCGMQVMRKVLQDKSHYKAQCTTSMTCSKCEQVIMKKQQEEHERQFCMQCECACEHERYGCTWVAKRNLLQAHLQNECAYERMKTFVVQTKKDNDLLKRQVQELEIQGNTMQSQHVQLSKILSKVIVELDEARQSQIILQQQVVTLQQALQSVGTNSNNTSATQLPMVTSPTTPSSSNLMNRFSSFIQNVASNITSTEKKPSATNASDSTTTMSYMDYLSDVISQKNSNTTVVPQQQQPAISVTKPTTPVTQIKPRKENEWIVTGSKDGTIHIWNVKTGTFMKQLTSSIENTDVEDAAHRGIVWDMKVIDCKVQTTQGPTQLKLLVSCSSDKSIKIWNIKSRTCIKAIENAHDQGIRSLLVFQSPTEQYLVSAATDGTLKLWSIKDIVATAMSKLQNSTVQAANTIQEVASIEAHSKGTSIYAMEGINGKYLCTAAADQTIRIFTVTKGELKHVKTLLGHEGPVLALYNNRQHATDVNLLFSADASNIRVWDMETLTCVRVVKPTVAPIVSLAGYYPVNKPNEWYLVSGSIDSQIRIWKKTVESSTMLPQLDCVSTLKGHAGWVTCMSCCTFTSVDSKITTLVSGSQDKSLRIWTLDDALQQKQVQPLSNAHVDTILCMQSFPA